MAGFRPPAVIFGLAAPIPLLLPFSMAEQNPHIGSSFDDFLTETGDLAEVSAVAVGRVVAWDVVREMEDKLAASVAIHSKVNGAPAACKEPPARE